MKLIECSENSLWFWVIGDMVLQFEFHRMIFQAYRVSWSIKYTNEIGMIHCIKDEYSNYQHAKLQKRLNPHCFFSYLPSKTHCPVWSVEVVVSIAELICICLFVLRLVWRLMKAKMYRLLADQALGFYGRNRIWSKNVLSEISFDN